MSNDLAHYVSPWVQFDGLRALLLTDFSIWKLQYMYRQYSNTVCTVCMWPIAQIIRSVCATHMVRIT